MEIKDNCCNGECSHCGECCAIGLPITRKEEKEIRKYIKKNNIKKQEIYNPITNTLFARCCFYNPKKKICEIYPVRPEICRKFCCNQTPEEIQKQKAAIHAKAYWNHAELGSQMVTNMTTFDWLFYNDPEPLVKIIHSYLPQNMSDNDKIKALRYYLIMYGRKDIVDIMDMQMVPKKIQIPKKSDLQKDDLSEKNNC